MNESMPSGQRRTVILGVVLVIVGVIAFVMSMSGVDVDQWIGDSGWPIFVIVPGLVLCALAFVPKAPAGVGFAIAGSIVTSVGVLLWYQELSEHWESWSYAWALIGPGAAGLGMLWYGLVTRTQRLVTSGAWLAGIGLVLFLAGAWFFETIFDTGRVPFDLGDTWPVILIAIGVVVIVASLYRDRTVGGHRGGPAPGGIH